MNRARRREVVDATRSRVAIILQNLFVGDRDPFFDDAEEQALAEKEIAKITDSIWPG